MNIATEIFIGVLDGLTDVAKETFETAASLPGEFLDTALHTGPMSDSEPTTGVSTR